ncbi:hypothetical protein Salat_0399200 [Sesamum alatum]|uniref:Uncharacterized protein n=1 Tax=Sesamum alatum TaxID=300844 RepID=A0AAE2CZW5_9LAMI|nr:hypothetical protein Salat_0399200 [Sesamum alatum]
MASTSLHQLQRRPNHDRLSFGSMFSENRRRGSTSQMCLHKILSIITTVPPPLVAASPPCSGSETKESSAENETSGENKGSGFDLNVGFSIAPELKELESLEADASGLSSSSTTALDGGGSAAGDGGCFEVNPGNGCDRVEHGDGVSENSRVKIEGEEKSLTLLIEAAKLIFGEFKDKDKPESEKQNVSPSSDSELKKDETAEDIIEAANERKLRRRSSCWTEAGMGGEFEESPSSPVVRSKRGRTQILPTKYKDSVLEPLTRLSRPRSSIVQPKRRRR